MSQHGKEREHWAHGTGLSNDQLGSGGLTETAVRQASGGVVGSWRPPSELDHLHINQKSQGHEESLGYHDDSVFREMMPREEPALQAPPTDNVAVAPEPGRRLGKKADLTNVMTDLQRIDERNKLNHLYHTQNVGVLMVP